RCLSVVLFFNHPTTTEIYTLSLHDALPIYDDYDNPLFKSEINDCIKIFEVYFNKVKIKHILPEGSILHFELVDGKKSETYRFERSEEHTSELQSRENLVCRLLLEKKKIYIL